MPENGRHVLKFQKCPTGSIVVNPPPPGELVKQTSPERMGSVTISKFIAPLGFTQFSKLKASDKVLSIDPKEATEWVKGFAKALGPV